MVTSKMQEFEEFVIMIYRVARPHKVGIALLDYRHKS